MCECVVVMKGKKNQGVCCQTGDLKVMWGRSFGLELVSLVSG